MSKTVLTALQTIDRLVILLSKVSLFLAGVCVLALVVLGSFDHIMVWLLWVSIPSAMELQQVLEASLIFLALASVQHQNAHISIDLVQHMFGAKAHRVSTIFGLMVMIIFYALITWQAYHLALRSVHVGETSPGRLAFAIYPFKMLIFIGMAFALLEAVRQFVRAVFVSNPGENAAGA